MFLHPWAIALGLVAAGLPVVIHWLTRPRPVRLPLSTLRFVEVVVKQRRALWRLRDALVLALRTLAVLAIAAAIARPWFRQTEISAATSNARLVRVVMLDTSQSMAARSGATPAFERARPLALKNLEYQPGLDANLILAGAKPSGVFSRPSSNFAALHEALVEARPRPERLRVQEALNLAADMLAAGGGADADGIRRELVVVSDFARSNWAAADFTSLPADTEIRLESVAPQTTAANLAVLGVTSAGRAEVGREARLEVVVGNFSPAAVRVRVEVGLGTAAHQLEGDCPPHTRTTLAGEIIVQDPGWQIGRARLLGNEDALPDDDERAFVLEVRPPPVYAIISRQDQRKQPSSSYYLERALAPYVPNEQRQAVRVVRLHPDNLDREALGPAETIVLNRPGRLSNEVLQLLAALHRRGRGILYVASEAIDAANLKSLTETVAGGLQLPVEFLPPAAGQPRRNLFVAESRRDQSPFEIFGDQLPALIEGLRFSGGLLTRPVPDALADDVLARFNDQSAFLVSASSQAGAVVVLNADLEESNLHSSPLFVPLLGELIQRRLSGRDRRDDGILCGEPFALLLPAELESAAGMELSGPGGAVKSGTANTGAANSSTADSAGALVQESQGVLWRGEAAGPPGAYQVRRDDQLIFAMASGIPAEESDLRELSADVFEGRLSGGRHVQYRSVTGTDTETRDDLWAWLAVACVACLLGEIGVLRAFRT